MRLDVGLPPPPVYHFTDRAVELKGTTTCLPAVECVWNSLGEASLHWVGKSGTRRERGISDNTKLVGPGAWWLDLGSAVYSWGDLDPVPHSCKALVSPATNITCILRRGSVKRGDLYTKCNHSARAQAVPGTQSCSHDLETNAVANTCCCLA